MSRLTSDNQVHGDGDAVHLRLHGARVLPRMPQLDVPNHNVSSRMLLPFSAHTRTRTHASISNHKAIIIQKRKLVLMYVS